MIGNREVSGDQRQQTDRQRKSLWVSNKDNNNNNNKGFQGACVRLFAWQVDSPGGAGFVTVVSLVGSTFYRWDLPLHASRVAFRVLSSILGENASAATIWWPPSVFWKH